MGCKGTWLSNLLWLADAGCVANCGGWLLTGDLVRCEDRALLTGAPLAVRRGVLDNGNALRAYLMAYVCRPASPARFFDGRWDGEPVSRDSVSGLCGRGLWPQSRLTKLPALMVGDGQAI